MKKKHKRLLVDIASVLMSLTGGVLFVAQNVTAIPMIPAEWSDKWALLVIISGILNKTGQSLISQFEPEKPNARSNKSTDDHATNSDSAASDARPDHPGPNGAGSYAGLHTSTAEPSQPGPLTPGRTSRESGPVASGRATTSTTTQPSGALD